MAQEIGTHRVTVSRVSLSAPPDTGDPVEVYWRESQSTISEAASAGQALVALLRSASATEVRVPITVAGTGVRGQDYELRTGPGLNSPLLPADVIVFPAGSTAQAIYLSPVDDGASEVTETVLVSLAESSATGGAIVGAVLGSPVTHTVFIENAAPGSDPVVSFAVGTSTISEGDEGDTTQKSIRLVLSKPAVGGELVTYTTGGSASGADFFITPGTVQWAAGQTEATLLFSAVGDDVINPDETVEITLASPTGLTIGSLATHVVTIEDDDEGTGPIVVQWAQSVQFVSEGSGQRQIVIQVTEGGTTHGGMTLAVSVIGSGTTAIPGVDYTLDSRSVTIPPGIAQSAALVTLLQNDDSDENRTLQLELTTDDATVGPKNVIDLTIQDSGSGDFKDGDLFSTLGERLAPERVQFDENDPHILCYANRVEVVTDIAGTQGIMLPPGGSSSLWVMYEALRQAEAIWKAINPTTWMNAEMGDELECVRIQARDRNWNSSEQTIIGGSSGQFAINGSPTEAPSWNTVQSDVGKKVMRDIIIYPEFPQPYIAWTTAWAWDFSLGIVDNFRLERIHAQGRHFVKSPFFVSKSNDGSAQGRIKLYDVFGQNRDDGTGTFGWGSSSAPRRQKWGLRAAARASWDIRHQANLPYVTMDSCEEHYVYVDAPQGPKTWPKMLGNYFIGVRGSFVDPPWRTAIQVASRPLSNPGDNGSGDLIYIRCQGLGVGGEVQSGGQGFTVWTHDGRVYFKDCEYLQGPWPKSMGGLGLLSDLGWACEDEFPHGTPVYEIAPGEMYQTPEVVIDGYTYDVSSQGSQSRTAMKFYGVQTVRLIKFEFKNATSDQIGMNSGGYPGLGFTKTFDVSELRYPDSHPQAGELYTGPFSQYPGFAPGTKLGDGYHRNWYDLGGYLEQSYPLSDRQINLYPASTVPQQYAGRLVEGLGNIPDWEPQSGEVTKALPGLPELGFTSSAPLIVSAQEVATYDLDVTMGQASMCRLRYAFAAGAGSTAVQGQDWVFAQGSPGSIVGPQTVTEDWDVPECGQGYLLYRNGEIQVTVLADFAGTASRTVDVEIVNAELELPKGSGTYVLLQGSALGFPPRFDEGSTGTTSAGVPYTGPNTILTDNTVIEGVIFDTTLTIAASNVTIRNCLFSVEGADYCLINTGGFSGSESGLVVEDCEFRYAENAVLCIEGTYRRIYIHDVGADGIKLQQNSTSFVWEDSYVTRIGNTDYNPNPDVHGDGIQVREDQGGSMRIHGVNFDCWNNGPEFLVTACILLQAKAGSITGNIVIEECYLGGGSYPVYLTDPASFGAPSDVSLLDNIWNTPEWLSGPLNSAANETAVTGNRRGDTGANVDAELIAGTGWS